MDMRSSSTERDLELGVKQDMNASAEDNEIFFECEESGTVEHSDVHPHLPEETVAAQHPLPHVLDGAASALPCLMGHSLKTINKIFTSVAGTVGFALLISFLGLTFTPISSTIYLPLDSTCGTPTDYGARLYEVVTVGLCITTIEFLASLLGAGNKEIEAAEAEPHVPVVRRVCIFIAAVSHLGLTICVMWSLLLALSLRMGKFSCWKHVFSVMLLAGFTMISSLSMYIVFIGLMCVFGTN